MQWKGGADDRKTDRLYYTDEWAEIAPQGIYPLLCKCLQEARNCIPPTLWELLHKSWFHDTYVAYGIVHKGANEYVLPEDTLDTLLAHLRMTFALKDSPSCGFDESYMITLWNAEHQLVSKLLIALDGGCGIFQIGDTHYYLEGKDDAREIIAKFLSSLDSNSAAAEK